MHFNVAQWKIYILNCSKINQRVLVCRHKMRNHTWVFVQFAFNYVQREVYEFISTIPTFAVAFVSRSLLINENDSLKKKKTFWEFRLECLFFFHFNMIYTIFFFVVLSLNTNVTASKKRMERMQHHNNICLYDII
jgi:hypothetical protein